MNFNEDQFPNQIGAARNVESCCNVNLVTDRNLDTNALTIHATDLWLKSYSPKTEQKKPSFLSVPCGSAARRLRDRDAATRVLASPYPRRREICRTGETGRREIIHDSQMVESEQVSAFINQDRFVRRWIRPLWIFMYIPSLLPP